MRLLIIEDDKALGLVMKEGLEKRGFRLTYPITPPRGRTPLCKAVVTGTMFVRL